MNMITGCMGYRQRGAVLVVGMIMLVLLTILGLATMRTTLLEERMAGYLGDHNLAFQAAEAALREGEMLGPTSCAASGFNGANGCYDLPTECQNDKSDDDLPSCWEGRDNPAGWPGWETNGRPTTTKIDQDHVAAQPRYVVERITTTSLKKGDSLKAGDEYEEMTYYRITARGVGGNANTVALVQSTYRP